MGKLFKKSKVGEKLKIVDYTKLRLNMLLYKSRLHYTTWVAFNENIPVDLKEEFGENPQVRLPNSFWARLVDFPQKGFFLRKEFLGPPTIVDTFEFTEGDLNLAREEYQLFDSEIEIGQCPFCRVNPSDRHMRILSEKFKNGTLEAGGVCIPCIHLLFEDDYEPLSPNELWSQGWQMSSGLRVAVKSERTHLRR